MPIFTKLNQQTPAKMPKGVKKRTKKVKTLPTGSLIQILETELMQVYALQEELMTTSDMRTRSIHSISQELHYQLTLTMVVSEELASRDDTV